jgi:hypothetical protein
MNQVKCLVSGWLDWFSLERG